MNQTLQNAKRLLHERYRINHNCVGAMDEYNRLCAIQLMYVTAELEAQLCFVDLLKKQIIKLEQDHE